MLQKYSKSSLPYFLSHNCLNDKYYSIWMQHRWQFPNLQVFFGFFSVWTRPPPLCRIFPENANLSKFVFLTGNFFFAKIKSFKIHFIIEEEKNKKINLRSIVKRDVIYIHASWYRHQENAASAPQAKIQKFQLPTHNPNFLSQMAKNVLRQKGHSFTNLQQKYNMKDVRPISFK